MRVVAGELRGPRLAAPPGRSVRPTADRGREARFSIHGEVSGLRVLDLFAGTGALGIEALSRGASEAVFVDSSHRAAATVRANLDALGLDGAVTRRDALAFLRQEAPGPGYEIVFIDPPYDLAGRLAAPLTEHLPAILTHDARIVTESDKRNPLSLPFPLLRERTYGDTRLTVQRDG